MRIVITGADGRLAKEFIRYLKNETLFTFTKHELDCTDRANVIMTVHSLKPDLILHCAAMTDVDGCEEQPMKAFSVNCLAVQNIAEAAGSCPLFLFSTDYVFSKPQLEPYTETQFVHPATIYALSKWVAEQSVCHLSNVYTIRTSWLFGGDGDFVEKIVAKAKTDGKLVVVDDQVGSPTYIHDLVQWTWALRAYDPGVYHLANAGACSRFEWAEEIKALLSLQVEIQPIPTSALKQKAIRPKHTVLSTEKFQRTTKQSIRSWKDALKEYVMETRI